MPEGRFLRIFVAAREGTGSIYAQLGQEGIRANFPDIHIQEGLDTQGFSDRWSEDPETGDLYVELYDESWYKIHLPSSLETEAAALMLLNSRFDYELATFGARIGYGAEVRMRSDAHVEWTRVVNDPSRGVLARVSHWALPKGRFLRIFIAADRETGRISVRQGEFGLERSDVKVRIREMLMLHAFDTRWEEDLASEDLWVSLFG